jgi:hypothetical protein
MTMNVDVAIAGGGPAASAAALTLARHGASSVIVERRDDEGAKPGESLPPSARWLLEQLGIAGALKEDGHLPCHGNRSVWGSDRVEELPFVMTPYGHGWHLDRRRFERLLIDRACDAGATRLTRTNVERVERDGDGWRLRFVRAFSSTPPGAHQQSPAASVRAAFTTIRRSHSSGSWRRMKMPIAIHSRSSNRNATAGGTRRSFPIASSRSRS